MKSFESITGQGLRAEATWTHRNLFPPEGALIVHGVAGTQETGVPSSAITRQAIATWRGAVGFSGRFSQVAARNESPTGINMSEDLTFDGLESLTSSPGAFGGAGSLASSSRISGSSI